MKILFNGFRHGHIYGLYDEVKKNDKLEIAACLEENLPAREEAKKAIDVTFDDDSYDNWLKKDVDIVAIGGRYGERGQMAIKALKAGKHVISDKPLCISLEELDEIEKLAKEKNLKVGIMLDLRDNPAACLARDILMSGKLGEVRNVSFNGQHCLAYGTRPSWYFEPGMHGGTINDIAIHGIDLIRYLTGLEYKKTDGARTWNAYADKEPHFDDCAVFMAELSNGAEVMADISYAAPVKTAPIPDYWAFKFWCAKGMLTFGIIEDKVTIYEENNPEPQVYEAKKPERNYLDDFMDEIANDTFGYCQSVMDSTRAVLEIQQVAYKNR